MNRRDFLRFAPFIPAVVVAAPAIAAKEPLIDLVAARHAEAAKNFNSKFYAEWVVDEIPLGEPGWITAVAK